MMNNDFESSFNLNDSIEEISFTFSDSEDEPKSVNFDLGNGSPINFEDFTGVHYNIDSITAPGRLEALSSVAQTLSVNYIVINESKLDQTIPNNLISIANFHDPIRSDRNRHGGGCLIYISSNLTFKHQTQLQSKHYEHLWVDIKVKNKLYSINALYRPPNETNADHLLFINECESIFSKMAKHKLTISYWHQI